MNLRYQLIFVMNFLFCILIMKALSWFFTPQEKRPSFLNFEFGWPYLSVRSLRVVAPPPSISPWRNFFMYTCLMLTILAVVKFFLSPVNYFDRILLGIAIYFFTESIGALGQALYAWRNENIFSIHDRPLFSPSLSEFWGRRWNLWVQDWIADMGRPFRRTHKTKILASFLFSGLFHEAMVNLPHWLISGESYFGTMMAYFFIQGAGLYLDKRIFRHQRTYFRRAFCWIVVVLPVPLFINVPLLRFFGMTE